MDFLKNNPAWFAATIEALIAAVMNLVIVFGLNLTVDQVAAVNGVVLIVTALILGIITKTAIDRKVENAVDAKVEEIAKAR